MSHFALVTFAAKNETALPETNLFRRIFAAIKKRKCEIGPNKIELYNNVSVHVVKLPYSVDELAGINRNKIGRIISEVLTKNGVKDCVLPQNLKELHDIGGCINNKFSGRFLYKLLLLDILKEIYCSKGIEMSGLDISIIGGSNRKELYSLVRLLSPMVKYVTVIASDKKAVEDEMGRVYIDFGLSIGVTTNYKYSLKNTDLIINLADSNEYMFNSRVNPKALILNYGVLNVSRILSGNALINGIEVRLPERILSILGHEVCMLFDISKLAEIILAYRVNSPDGSGLQLFDSKLMKKVSEEFRKDGYAISGFIGRRRTLKTDEIPVQVRKEEKES